MQIAGATLREQVKYGWRDQVQSAQASQTLVLVNEHAPIVKRVCQDMLEIKRGLPVCMCLETSRAASGGRRAGVMSGSRDQTVRVWDLESGQEVTRWEGEAVFQTCTAIVLDTGAEDDRPSLVIAAGDVGGHVHVLELMGDRETITSKPKEGNS